MKHLILMVILAAALVPVAVTAAPACDPTLTVSPSPSVAGETVNLSGVCYEATYHGKTTGYFVYVFDSVGNQTFVSLYDMPINPDETLDYDIVTGPAYEGSDIIRGFPSPDTYRLEVYRAQRQCHQGFCTDQKYDLLFVTNHTVV